MPGSNALASSFRDPAGFLYCRDGCLYRQINTEYSTDYDLLNSSGLYATLVKAKLLIPHTEVGIEFAENSLAYKVIRPELIQTISYPYEWCFSQLKDAALTTIKIQRIALKFGMVLKDASAYNIQFHHGKPIFIDTLSFAKYREGEPWVAYMQFCQHFVAPLALMSFKDCRLAQLSLNHIDGVPLDLASKLLPLRSYLKYSLLVHLHLHAKAQQKYANSSDTYVTSVKPKRIEPRAYSAFLQGLHNTIKALHWKFPETEWGDYYSTTNYQDHSMRHKETLVEEFLSSVAMDRDASVVHDLGANAGHFRRIATRLGFSVV